MRRAAYGCRLDRGRPACSASAFRHRRLDLTNSSRCASACGWPSARFMRSNSTAGESPSFTCSMRAERVGESPDRSCCSALGDRAPAADHARALRLRRLRLRRATSAPAWPPAAAAARRRARRRRAASRRPALHLAGGMLRVRLPFGAGCSCCRRARPAAGGLRLLGGRRPASDPAGAPAFCGDDWPSCFCWSFCRLLAAAVLDSVGPV